MQGIRPIGEIISSAAGGAGGADMIQYVWACPHLPCRGSGSLQDFELRAEGPGVRTAERQCPDCKGWARIMVTGPSHALTVEKGIVPAVAS